MKARRRTRRKPSAVIQRGQAFLLSVVLLLIGAGALIYNLASPGKVEIDKDRITAEALAKAKAALIGYAAGVTDFTGGERPGDLPCPDLNDSGTPLATGITNCNSQATRIGRLPWKTLGLPDLRDGDGERLWYAVSDNFKDNTRTVCPSPGGVAGCLNSDARGTITVRNSDGTVVNNGNDAYGSFNPSGVIAVIFAPGAILQRQGAIAPQDRSCPAGSCTAAGVCNVTPYTNVPKCNPVNYLDVITGAFGTADNATFTDGSATDGFIQGPIRDMTGPVLDTGGNTRGNLIVNDRLIVITYQDLMPALQRRVGQEVMKCLDDYAATAQNRGRYPWAVPITTVTPPYNDSNGTRFGRVPDNPLSATLLGVGGSPATTICQASGNLSLCMRGSWIPSCGITQGNWWTNWKEMVFYGVAAPYAPASPTGNWWDPWSWGQLPWPGGCGTCLTVDPPSASSDKRVVVIVAGKRLSAVGGGQPRATGPEKSDATNYVEGQNDGGATQNVYTYQPTSTTFNDLVLYR